MMLCGAGLPAFTAVACLVQCGALIAESVRQAARRAHPAAYQTLVAAATRARSRVMAPAAKGTENGDTPNRKQRDKYVPQVGDLVFAKVRGHRFWPARVESDCPNGRKAPAGKYPVFFFGTYESAVVVAKDMVPYEENKEKHGKANRKDFAAAMREIAESPRITFTTRPAADPHPGLTTETISETKESGQSEVDAHSSDASDGRVPAAAECPVAAAGKRESKKRKREAAADSSAAKKNKKKKRKSAVSGADDGRQSVRTETGLAEQTDPGPGPQSQPVTQEAEKAADEKSGLDRLQKLKAKAEEKEKKKEELKAEKMMRKRQERLNQLKSQTVTTQMLRDVEAEIIESLSVGVRDVLRCLHAMSRLDLLPVTPALLTSYPDILVTIRKCRKYVHDEQVRKKADYLHYKYKNQFSDPGLDPVVRNKMKAIQMKQNSARGSSAPHPSDPAAGRGDDCSSQSQSPAESDPPAQTLTPASATAASPLPHPLAGSESLASTESVAAAIGDDVAGDTERGAVESKEEAAVVSGEQRSETLVGVASAQLMTSDDVSPVIAAVVEKITSAVTAAVPAPVVSPALVSDAAARSEVVAVDDETAENKQVRC